MARQKVTDIKALPDQIPVFPLNGVLLLPGGQLPLNIFEDRYLAMFDDALKSERLIGILQPRETTSDFTDETPLFEIGCAGRITSFEETDDGRYLTTLSGVCRFKTAGELGTVRGYRNFNIDWSDYGRDMNLKSCLDLDRSKLKELLAEYFGLHEISCDWDAIDDASDQKLITCLSMVCPFDAGEKQALLEAQCCDTRADMFMTMLEMAVRNGHTCTGGCH